MDIDDYGPKFRDHLLEQYKIYTEMADRISQRRATANSFFLTLHTGIFGLAVSLAGLSTGKFHSELASLIVSVFGVGFAIVWMLLLESYRQINSAKYSVLNDLEQLLPVAPYAVEWNLLAEGKDSKKYRQLTNVEKTIPALFVVGHILAIGLASYLIRQS
jgi:hypothetical protein